MDDYRFLQYAARFWFIHAHQNIEWSDKLISLTNKFFEPGSRRWALWSIVLDKQGLELHKDIMSVPVDLGNVPPNLLCFLVRL